MVGERGVAGGGLLGDGHGAGGDLMGAPIVEHLLAVDAHELAGGAAVHVLELLAEGGAERTAAHLPELSHAYERGVHLEGCAHGREQGGTGLAGTEHEQRLVLEAVYGVDDVVVGVEGEVIGGVGGINLLQRQDVGIGTDFEQMTAQRVDLDLAHGEGGGHELAVDIGGADAVGVDDGEVAYARAYEALGYPTANASDAEDDDAAAGDGLHHVVAHEQSRAVEDRIVCIHDEWVDNGGGADGLSLSPGDEPGAEEHEDERDGLVPCEDVLVDEYGYDRCHDGLEIGVDAHAGGSDVAHGEGYGHVAGYGGEDHDERHLSHTVPLPGGGVELLGVELAPGYGQHGYRRGKENPLHLGDGRVARADLTGDEQVDSPGNQAEHTEANAQEVVASGASVPVGENHEQGARGGEDDGDAAGEIDALADEESRHEHGGYGGEAGDDREIDGRGEDQCPGCQRL